MCVWLHVSVCVMHMHVYVHIYIMCLDHKHSADGNLQVMLVIFQDSRL